MNKTEIAPSNALGAKVIYAALQFLKNRGGEAPGRDIATELEKSVRFNEWECQTYQKTGNARWWSSLHFWSIDCVKAGYLIKKKGVWYLTPEGANALNLGELEFFRTIRAAYRKWKSEQPADESTVESDDESDDQLDQETSIDEIEQLAIEGLKRQVNQKNPYEFQELVAALLRGMGYYTPFVAPQGKDGGIDVVAYRDPLGAVGPRIKVQIKHRNSTTSVNEIRQLIGLLQKDGDAGMFVSSGGFTSDAKAFARGAHMHVELIDLERFIGFWQEFYSKLSEEDKTLLPLLPIYFYAPPV